MALTLLIFLVKAYYTGFRCLRYCYWFGEHVTRFREGDKVITQVYTRWLDGETCRRPCLLLGFPLSGVLSEYIVMNEEAVVAKPKYLTDEEAATLPIAALTAWNAITTVVISAQSKLSLFRVRRSRLVFCTNSLCTGCEGYHLYQSG
ncbi:alcohol dehydrogenase catalytic domain-containing protein [Chitinophaga pinensis]|uniref:alcohol dehydrogenase catalytic domain-containing protein n=1 Tax=Chitinophaga pinensis TaxID=79329 RepID=UPI00396561CF